MAKRASKRQKKGKYQRYKSHSGIAMQYYGLAITGTTRRMWIENTAILKAIEELEGLAPGRRTRLHDRLFSHALKLQRRSLKFKCEKLGIDYEAAIQKHWDRYYAGKEEKLPVKERPKVPLGVRMVDDFGPSV